MTRTPDPETTRPGPQTEVLPAVTEPRQAATREPDTSTRPVFLKGLSLREVAEIGNMAAAAGMFGKDLEAKSADEIQEVKARAFLKTVAALELDLPIVQGFGGFDVIEGRIAMRSGLMAQLLKRSNKYRYRVVKWDETVCELEWFERVDGKWESVGPSSFSLEDAVKAKLIDRPHKPAWQTYRKAMLMSRAVAQGARAYAADALGGAVYDPEELEPDPDDSDYDRHAEKLNRGAAAVTADAHEPEPPPASAAVPDEPEAPASSDGQPEPPAEPSPPPREAELGLLEIIGSNVVSGEQNQVSSAQINHLREIASPLDSAGLGRVIAWATRDDGEYRTKSPARLTTLRYQELRHFFENAKVADVEVLVETVQEWERRPADGPSADAPADPESTAPDGPSGAVDPDVNPDQTRLA